MKFAPLLLLVVLAQPTIAQVFRCGEPKGTAMWSMKGHEPIPDGFSGVNPIVIIDAKEMTILWGDAKSAGGADKAWKAVIVHKSANAVSAVALDADPTGSATMLYTMDIKRGFLYMSNHKEGGPLDASGASSFVSTCAK